MRRFAGALLVAGALIAACAPETPPPPVDDEVARIVTLAPHLAEMAFAVGAGDLIVGVSAYTDFPAEAAALPIVGDAFNLDMERLALLTPDVLLAWNTGTPAHIIDDLRSRGYRVEVITTTGIRDMADAMRRIGQLTGREANANTVADTFEEALQDVIDRFSGAPPIRVFYQIAARPLYTINGNHYLSHLIEMCGGENVFDDLDGLAPLITVEAVLERDPEVILAS